jgi:hypothetical protein
LAIELGNSETTQAMSGTNGAKALQTSCLNSALLVTAVLLVVALLIAPFASGRSGSGGLGGLTIAVAICLSTAWVSELVAALLVRHASPLAMMALGMVIRMVPPLAVCVWLAARGISGRDHLAFIFYLLAFYLVTLFLETWSSVARISASNSHSNSIAG